MKKKIVFSALVLLIMVSLFLVYGGRFLIYKKSVPVAGKVAIIPLMGSLPDRSLQAAELYHAVPEAQVVFVSPIEPNKVFLDSLGLPVSHSAAVFRMALLRMGVPGSDIAYLRGPANSTQDEADLMARALKRDGEVRSVVLVTSSYHSRRAYWIFRDRFKKAGLDITINVSPSRYTDFNPVMWWRRKNDASVVVTEWLKIIYYVLIGQFQ
jgi:uncharacterized SAM-binding protein YcdF (DUF218 family)